MINIVKKYTEETDGLFKKGIYVISHELKPNYFYVGSTKCKDGFYRRWYQHVHSLKKNNHSSPFLQNIFNKYGHKGLLFKIIEIIDEPENLYIREQYWLDYYSLNHNVLNYAPIVAANSMAMTDIVKQKISKSLSGKYTGKDSGNAKKIYMYSSSGDFINLFECISDAAKHVGSLNNNFYIFDKPQYHKGFLFSRSEMTDLEVDYFKRFGASNRYWYRKPIVQYDLDGNFIKEWASARDAEKYYGIHHGVITQALTGLIKTSMKSIWKYLNYQNPWVAMNYPQEIKRQI